MPGTHPKSKTNSYTEEQLMNALTLIENGISYREASAAYNVPRSTLFKKRNGKSEKKLTKRGTSPLLPQDVENRLELVIFLSQKAY